VRPWRAFAWLRQSLKNWAGSKEEESPIMAVSTSVWMVEWLHVGFAGMVVAGQKTLGLEVDNRIL
jgi:hypothetical protein